VKPPDVSIEVKPAADVIVFSPVLAPSPTIGRPVMKAAAESAIAPDPAPRAPGRAKMFWSAAVAWLNRAAAELWLNIFFWQARRHPRFLRAVKAFVVHHTWRFSEHLYGGTMANAARILGSASTLAQRETLSRGMLGAFYDFVCDVGSSVGLSRQQMLGRIESVEGEHHYRAARDSGPLRKRGAIIVTAHMGSFEVGTAALREKEPRVHVLFRRDERGGFERIRAALRKKLGVIEAPVDDGWTVWLRLRDALRNDEVVVIQCDRVMPGQKGQAVKFFDGHMLLPTGPVRLALASGAPIIPIFSVRTASGAIRLFIEEPIVVGETDGALSVDAAMEKVGAVLEKYVRQFPEQWLENRPAWIEDAGKPMPRPPGKRWRIFAGAR